jgi:mycothiol synthase
MSSKVVADLVITRAESDADLDAMVAVRARTDPDLPLRRENLRHNLDAIPQLAYFVALVAGEPVGCAFLELSDTTYAQGHVLVVEDVRRRGIGTALLREISTGANAGGKTQLQGEVRVIDTDARAYLERRGYGVVGGEQAVALELAAVDPVTPEPPAGVQIVTRAERPDALEGMYEISIQADEDIPGNDEVRTFEMFRAQDIDRPTRTAELCFVALSGDEVVGYAVLDDHRPDAFHGLTAVKRAWRRRGVATALKRAQIATAKQRGFRRLITESEERNEPMRRLNEMLGYLPEPSLSTVVLRGPLVN